jgi:hypothetical protein
MEVCPHMLTVASQMWGLMLNNATAQARVIRRIKPEDGVFEMWAVMLGQVTNLMNHQSGEVHGPPLQQLMMMMRCHAGLGNALPFTEFKFACEKFVEADQARAEQTRRSLDARIARFQERKLAVAEALESGTIH